MNGSSTYHHSLQRKAAIARGGIADHAADVEVSPIPDFDLGRTIFHTLQGRLPRFVIKTRIAKEAEWSVDGRARVESAYEASRLGASETLPDVPAALREFLERECDFDMEHADGSFLDHLFFCYEYTHRHYPGRDPLVMFLHSILGTGTNTFAMKAEKMGDLRELVDANGRETWRHVSAFPSILRLLYDVALRRELRANRGRLDQLQAIRCRRVIDHEALELPAEDFWVQMNYQLIHLVDFVPVSNWRAHANESGMILFRDLYELLQGAGRMEAHIGFQEELPAVRGERRGLGGWLVDHIPISVSEKLTARSVRRFSAEIGHSLDYELVWG